MDEVEAMAMAMAMAMAPVPTPEVLWREHLSDVVAGYGTNVDFGVIRVWWSLRSLGAVRWLVGHGFGPWRPGCEVDVLRSQL